MARYKGVRRSFTLTVEGYGSYVLECYSMEFRVKARAFLDKYAPEWSVAIVSFERDGETVDNGRLYNR